MLCMPRYAALLRCLRPLRRVGGRGPRAFGADGARDGDLPPFHVGPAQWSVTSAQLQRWSELVAIDVHARASLIAEHDGSGE